MPRLKNEELSTLYPSAKTPKEIDTELKILQLAGRPHYIATKVSAYLSLNILILFLTYKVVAFLANNFTSEGSVITNVSMIILISLFVLFVIGYIYKTATSILGHVTDRLGEFYIWHVSLLFILGIILTLVANIITFPLAVGVVAVNYMLTFVIVRMLIK